MIRATLIHGNVDLAPARKLTSGGERAGLVFGRIDRRKIVALRNFGRDIEIGGPPAFNVATRRHGADRSSPAGNVGIATAQRHRVRKTPRSNGVIFLDRE